MSAKSLRRFSGPAWLALAATLAGAALRYLGLLTLPPPAWVDEIWFALRAREILQTGQFPIFYKTFWGGVNPLLAWLTAGAQWLAFRDVSVSSRVVSATFSVLAVPLFFAALDEFWRAEVPAPRRRWLAALASLALAFFFSTITLTRLGTEPGVALAAGLFCLWQQRRAARTGARLSFALAGLGVGAAQYLSPHARFIPVLMVLWGLHDLALAPAGQRRRLLGGLALAAAVAALSAAPLIAFFVREPEWFLGRARAVTAAAGSQGLLAFWLTNAGKLALAFSWAGDPSGRDNLAGRPYLDVVQSLGFYLGLGLTLWRARRSARARDLLVWLAVMLAPSLVTDDAPSFSRLIQLAPPALALTVLGWNALWAARPAWLGRAAAAGVAGLALAVSLAGNVADYFGRFAQQPDLAAWYTATPVRLAQDLIARAPAEAVFVERVLEAEDIFAFDFLFPGTAVRRLDFRQCLPLAAGRPTPTTYVVWSERDPFTAPALRRAFPQAQVTVLQPESEALVKELTVVSVPAGATALVDAQPVAARFAPGLELIGVAQSPAEVRPGESVFLTLYWRATAAVDADVIAFLHVGTGLDGTPPIVQRDGQPCQGFYPTSRWQAGDLVPDSFAVTVPPDAPAGDYPLAIGWYRYPSLERLPLEGADQPLPDNRAVIGSLRVAAP